MTIDGLGAKARAVWAERGTSIRRWLVTLGLGMLVAWAVWQYVSRPTVLAIAVGPQQSVRYEFIQEVAKRLAEARKPVRLKLVPVKDGGEAVRLLNSEKVQLAVLRSDQRDAVDARSFAIVDRRAVLLVAAADPVKPKDAKAGDTKSVEAKAAEAKAVAEKAADASEDGEASAVPGPLSASRLIGRRIVVASDGAGFNKDLVERLLGHAGLSGQAVSFTRLSSGEVARAIAANRFDVAALVVDPTTEETRRLIADIAKALGGQIVVGPPPSPEGLAAVHRDLSTFELAAGVFGGTTPLPPVKMTTVAITEEIVGDSDIEDATGAQLTKALLEVRGRLTAMPNQSLEIETPPLDALRRFMPHAGVAAHINERSTTFLEKYSDQIWLGLFALGLVGSSVAGFAGRLGLRAPAEIVDRLPQDVARLIGGIEDAKSEAEIDALRRELRALAAGRLREAVAEGLDAGDASHPSQWFALIDALATSRAAEFASAASSSRVGSAT